MAGVYDVIVVGGGPGGSSCASLLGMKGVRVLLVDKASFPRDKTCGDAVSGKSATVLRELGLIHEVEKLRNAPVLGTTFSSPEGVIVEVPFPLNKEGKPQGYVCRRMDYDNMLFTNARKVLGEKNVWERFMVTDVLKDEKGFVTGVTGTDLKTGRQKEVRAKIVVGADGATSVVASKLGLGKLDPRHHCVALRGYYQGITGMKNNIEIHFVEEVIPGYFWIFPLDDGYANVGVGMLTSDVNARKTNLKQAMLDVIEKSPLFAPRFKNAKLVGEIKGWNLPFGSHHRRAHGDGFVLLGDAASLIDPFSGEGVGNAMTSASYAVPVIEKALKSGDYSAKALKEYEDKLWDRVAGELSNSYKLQKLGKNRWLLNWVIRRASRKPRIREALSAMLSNNEEKKQLSSPWFYLRMLFM
ncbi:MAG: geranylgeranyl reductase family protein [Candidatus Micrarchaeota archaeon]